MISDTYRLWPDKPTRFHGKGCTMHVLDAIATRRTVRSFSARRPTRAQIESILKNACRAPSIRNDQPWRVKVFAEDALADLVNAAAAGESLAAKAPPLWAPDVRAARIDDGALRRGGLRFYEAPVGLLCTIDRNATREQWLDHGCFINNIILASNAFAMSACVIGDFQGLEACIKPRFPVASDEEITVGIGIGYADRARERMTERRPLEAFSEFHWD